MKRILLVLALVLSAAPAFAQEKATLSSPQSLGSVTDYSINEYRFNKKQWTVFLMLDPNVAAAPSVWCQWGTQTRTVSTPNPPINGVPQPDTVVSTPNVGVQCSNGYSNINAPVGFADVATMMKALNKTNNSSTSLDKRVYNQAIADGVLTASVTGVPQ